MLKTTANVIQNLIRTPDIIGRYGGEEFIVISPETGIEGAAALAEKIRAVVERHSYPVVGNITISAGVAGFTNNDLESTFIKRADDALYIAKNNGRNRVEIVNLNRAHQH